MSKKASRHVSGLRRPSARTSSAPGSSSRGASSRKTSRFLRGRDLAAEERRASRRRSPRLQQEARPDSPAQTQQRGRSTLPKSGRAVNARSSSVSLTRPDSRAGKTGEHMILWANPTRARPLIPLVPPRVPPRSPTQSPHRSPKTRSPPRRLRASKRKRERETRPVIISVKIKRRKIPPHPPSAPIPIPASAPAPICIAAASVSEERNEIELPTDRKNEDKAVVEHQRTIDFKTTGVSHIQNEETTKCQGIIKIQSSDKSQSTDKNITAEVQLKSSLSTSPEKASGDSEEEKGKSCSPSRERPDTSSSKRTIKDFLQERGNRSVEEDKTRRTKLKEFERSLRSYSPPISIESVVESINESETDKSFESNTLKQMTPQLIASSTDISEITKLIANLKQDLHKHTSRSEHVFRRISREIPCTQKKDNEDKVQCLNQFGNSGATKKQLSPQASEIKERKSSISRNLGAPSNRMKRSASAGPMRNARHTFLDGDSMSTDYRNGPRKHRRRPSCSSARVKLSHMTNATFPHVNSQRELNAGKSELPVVSRRSGSPYCELKGEAGSLREIDQKNPKRSSSAKVKNPVPLENQKNQSCLNVNNVDVRKSQRIVFVTSHKRKLQKSLDSKSIQEFKNVREIDKMKNRGPTSLRRKPLFPLTQSTQSVTGRENENANKPRRVIHSASSNKKTPSLVEKPPTPKAQERPLSLKVSSSDRQCKGLEKVRPLGKRVRVRPSKILPDPERNILSREKGVDVPEQGRRHSAKSKGMMNVNKEHQNVIQTNLVKDIIHCIETNTLKKEGCATYHPRKKSKTGRKKSVTAIKVNHVKDISKSLEHNTLKKDNTSTYQTDAERKEAVNSGKTAQNPESKNVQENLETEKLDDVKEKIDVPPEENILFENDQPHLEIAPTKVMESKATPNPNKKEESGTPKENLSDNDGKKSPSSSIKLKQSNASHKGDNVVLKEKATNKLSKSSIGIRPSAYCELYSNLAKSNVLDRKSVHAKGQKKLFFSLKPFQKPNPSHENKAIQKNKDKCEHQDQSQKKVSSVKNVSNTTITSVIASVESKTDDKNIHKEENFTTHCLKDLSVGQKVCLINSPKTQDNLNNMQSSEINSSTTEENIKEHDRKGECEKKGPQKKLRNSSASRSESPKISHKKEAISHETAGSRIRRKGNKTSRCSIKSNNTSTSELITDIKRNNELSKELTERLIKVTRNLCSNAESLDATQTLFSHQNRGYNVKISKNNQENLHSKKKESESKDGHEKDLYSSSQFNTPQATNRSEKCEKEIGDNKQMIKPENLERNRTQKNSERQQIVPIKSHDGPSLEECFTSTMNTSISENANTESKLQSMFDINDTTNLGNEKNDKKSKKMKANLPSQKSIVAWEDSPVKTSNNEVATNERRTFNFEKLSISKNPSEKIEENIAGCTAMEWRDLNIDKQSSLLKSDENINHSKPETIKHQQRNNFVVETSDGRQIKKIFEANDFKNQINAQCVMTPQYNQTQYIPLNDIERTLFHNAPDTNVQNILLLKRYDPRWPNEVITDINGESLRNSFGHEGYNVYPKRKCVENSSGLRHKMSHEGDILGSRHMNKGEGAKGNCVGGSPGSRDRRKRLNHSSLRSSRGSRSRLSFKSRSIPQRLGGSMRKPRSANMTCTPRTGNDLRTICQQRSRSMSCSHSHWRHSMDSRGSMSTMDTLRPSSGLTRCQPESALFRWKSVEWMMRNLHKQPLVTLPVPRVWSAKVTQNTPPVTHRSICLPPPCPPSTPTSEENKKKSKDLLHSDKSSGLTSSSETADPPDKAKGGLESSDAVAGINNISDLDGGNFGGAASVTGAGVIGVEVPSNSSMSGCPDDILSVSPSELTTPHLTFSATSELINCPTSSPELTYSSETTSCLPVETLDGSPDKQHYDSVFLTGRMNAPKTSLRTMSAVDERATGVRKIIEKTLTDVLRKKLPQLASSFHSETMLNKQSSNNKTRSVSTPHTKSSPTRPKTGVQPSESRTSVTKPTFQRNSVHMENRSKSRSPASLHHAVTSRRPASNEPHTTKTTRVSMPSKQKEKLLVEFYKRKLDELQQLENVHKCKFTKVTKEFLEAKTAEHQSPDSRKLMIHIPGLCGTAIRESVVFDENPNKQKTNNCKLESHSLFISRKTRSPSNAELRVKSGRQRGEGAALSVGDAPKDEPTSAGPPHENAVPMPAVPSTDRFPDQNAGASALYRNSEQRSGGGGGSRGNSASSGSGYYSYDYSPMYSYDSSPRYSYDSYGSYGSSGYDYDYDYDSPDYYDYGYDSPDYYGYGYGYGSQDYYGSNQSACREGERSASDSRESSRKVGTICHSPSLSESLCPPTAVSIILYPPNEESDSLNQ